MFIKITILFLVSLIHAEFVTGQVQDKYLQQPTHDKDTITNITVVYLVGKCAEGKTCACKAYSYN